MKFIFSVSFCLFLSYISKAAIIYVDDDAQAGGNGQTWASAFKDLTTALGQASSGDEIRVAQGIYKPAPPNGNRETSFLVKNGTILRGGYAGLSHANANQWDPRHYVSTLSGDLNANDLPNFENYDDNTYHVVYAAYITNPNTLVEGFRITGGSASSKTCCFFQRGGGMYVVSSLLTVRNCEFTLNRASWPPMAQGRGGAMYIVTDSDVVVEASRFENNFSYTQGGAVYIKDSNPHFIDDDFVSNSSASGGALYSFVSNDILVENSRFLNNSSSYSGGAVTISSGQGGVISRSSFINNYASEHAGALYTSAYDMKVRDSYFSGNSAGSANTAIENRGSNFDVHLRISNSYFENQPGAAIVNYYNIVSGKPYLDLFNSVLINNHDGLIAYGGTHSRIINSTITANSNAGIIGVYADWDVLKLTNNIVWGNGDNSEYAQLAGDGEFLVSYSLIQNWSGIHQGEKVIDADPKFQADRFHLTRNSPCISGGTNEVLEEIPNYDIDGHNRVSGKIDMGADEVIFPATSILSRH
ncbi:MAG: hypothetical protein COV44_07970 [Deltaproteobacteria bacterium CG11_big_fil_rev_8_21_14_0_20_45_16]|nr:MAG: hypothetical protein COV44_07970 [Deltaproteobacteria bacterium CG11_big_fil_rev_8_21_14_0_20_45_16]